MIHDIASFDLRNVRGADSNSLLRMFDLAKEIVSKSALQQDRTRADKALRRIVKELEKRKIPFRTGPNDSALETR